MDNKKIPAKVVGFIGLGIMGEPMVNNLLKSNIKINFFARRKTIINKIKKLGGNYFSDIPQIAANSDIIILNLPDSSDVEEVITSVKGLWKTLKKKTIIIDMSTISPIKTQLISNKLKQKDSFLIDAPVSGGQIGAINANLSIMVGGNKKVFNKIKYILEILGENITYIGNSGSGQIAKACNQILAASTIISVSEILLLAKKSGCSQKLIRSALMGGFANSKILDIHGMRMINDDFEPGFKTELHLKDLIIALDLAKELGLELESAKYSKKIMNLANKKKYNNKDSSVAHKIIQNNNK